MEVHGAQIAQAGASGDALTYATDRGDTSEHTPNERRPDRTRPQTNSGTTYATPNTLTRRPRPSAA
jgi:hypothetical protein